MFNKRMVYFMGGEAHEQEQPGADVAKAKMAEFMPKPEELKGGKDDKAEVKQENMSMEDEAKQTNDMARADIMYILKEGQKQNAAQPIKGIDDWAGLIKDLKAGLGDGSHFNTSYQMVDTGTEKYHLMMVKDTKSSPAERLFVKKTNNFTIASRTSLRDVTDDQYKYLTGKSRPKQANA